MIKLLIVLLPFSLFALDQDFLTPGEKAAKKAETDRKKALRVRFKAVKDLRYSMELCGYKVANAKMFVKKIVESDDIEKLLCLESKKEEVKKRKDDSMAKQNKHIEDCGQLKLDTSLPGFAKRILLRSCAKL